MAEQNKQYCTDGGFLSDQNRPQNLRHPSMWIFKVHEKENQLNSNFSWILSWIVISLTSSR